MTPQLRHPATPRVGALSASLATTAANGLDNYMNNAMETSKDPRLGVLLLNLGGPETGDDVEGMHGMAWQQANSVHDSSLLGLFGFAWANRR